MRHRVVRALLALMMVIPAIAGLHRPAVASVPLALDVSDGYTFSGVQRTTKTGAQQEFFENTIGPFTVSGERGFVQLSWNKGQQDSYLNCDPAQFLRSITDTIQNHQTNHYSVDLTETSQMVELITFHVPTYENAGIGTTATFPLDAVEKSVTFFTPGGEVTVPMVPINSNAGEALAYQAAFDPPQPAGQLFNFDLTFQGEVEPSLSGNPQTAPLGCPAPNDDLESTTDFGLSQLFFFDSYVVVHIADDNPNQLPVLNDVLIPTVDEGQTADVFISGSDPDGGAVTLSLVDAPDFVTLVGGGDGSGMLVISPTFDDAGDHFVIVRVAEFEDDLAFADFVLPVTVNDVNRNPNLLIPVTEVVLNEGDSATITISSEDPDGDDLTISGDLPPFAALGPTENGIATLTFMPEPGDAGVYSVSLTVSDDGDPALMDTGSLTVIVDEVEGPGVESYDELEALVLAYVDNRFVERLLVGTVNLAQYFDEELGLDHAAVGILRTFIALVQAATPRWIEPQSANELIDFARQLIDGIVGP